MKRSALDFLICLKCESNLDLVIRSTEDIPGVSEPEIITGKLCCKQCAQTYPIVRGVPRFVLTESTSNVDILSGEKFASSWQRWDRFDERYRQQFFDWLNPVDAAFLRGKAVLECGCGKGRHTRVVAESGAKHVVAVDIGDSIDLAYAQAGRLPNVHVVQADIGQMPVKPIFDLAYSVGVLHHMDSPERGFKALAGKVKPNGSIGVWVYGRENNGWIVSVVTPLRLALTSKLPAPVLSLISGVLSIVLFFACKVIYRPWHQLRAQASWLPALFYEDYLSYIAQFDFTEIHNIVFDHLVAPVAEYLRRDELVTWFKNVGIPDPSLRWHNRNSWTGFGEYEEAKLERR